MTAIMGARGNGIFVARCGISGQDLSPANKTVPYLGKERQDQWKKVQEENPSYKFHRVIEMNNTLWVSEPVGFWLQDGRLVAPDHVGNNRIKAVYYGAEGEIAEMGRKISLA